MDDIQLLSSDVGMWLCCNNNLCRRCGVPLSLLYSLLSVCVSLSQTAARPALPLSSRVVCQRCSATASTPPWQTTCPPVVWLSIEIWTMTRMMTRGIMMMVVMVVVHEKVVVHVNSPRMLLAPPATPAVPYWRDTTRADCVCTSLLLVHTPGATSRDCTWSHTKSRTCGCAANAR